MISTIFGSPTSDFDRKDLADAGFVHVSFFQVGSIEDPDFLILANHEPTLPRRGTWSYVARDRVLLIYTLGGEVWAKLNCRGSEPGLSELRRYLAPRGRRDPEPWPEDGEFDAEQLEKRRIDPNWCLNYTELYGKRY